MKQITITNPEKIQNPNISVLPAAQITVAGEGTSCNPDYIGPDGLLYCGSCHTPKEAYNEKFEKLTGRPAHPIMCRCWAEENEKEQLLTMQRAHEMAVSRLRRLCFPAKEMYNWTFENSRIDSEEMDLVKKYADNWEEAVRNNNGLLLWGSLGTGKTYAAACIANALLEKEVSVRLTSFPRIANDLFGNEEKTDYLMDLCNVGLLITDDFGAERKTEYMLETMWQVLELRTCFHKPLIVTTNLTLKELHDPPDDYIGRIYDRILALCAPLNICLTNLRENQAQEQLQHLTQLVR